MWTSFDSSYLPSVLHTVWDRNNSKTKVEVEDGCLLDVTAQVGTHIPEDSHLHICCRDNLKCHQEQADLSGVITHRCRRSG